MPHPGIADHSEDADDRQLYMSKKDGAQGMCGMVPVRAALLHTARQFAGAATSTLSPSHSNTGFPSGMTATMPHPVMASSNPGTPTAAQAAGGRRGAWAGSRYVKNDGFSAQRPNSHQQVLTKGA